MKKGNAAALAYVQRVFENVVVQPRDAREASDVFYKQKVGLHGGVTHKLHVFAIAQPYHFLCHPT